MWFRSTGLRTVAAVILIAGCDAPPSADQSPPIKKATESAGGVSGLDSSGLSGSSAIAGTGGIQAFDGMKFDVPAGWESQPLSQMQIGIIAAKFGMPAISADIQLTLSTSGGSLEDNIGRWEGQFSGGEPPAREVLSVNGGDATLVRLSGRFSPGFGRDPQDGWCMLGVIIPMTGQNYYVKLTGPQADVAAAEEAFLNFCRSARPE